MADNGGLVVAASGTELVTGIVPSQLLTFTALAASGNDGVTWSPGLLTARLSAVPGALAAARSGRLIAVGGHAAWMAAGPAGSWRGLATVAGISSGLAPRSCGLARLTAAAFSAAGRPVLAGACAIGGRVGIFRQGASGWRQVGPVAPPALAGAPITVVRPAVTSGGEGALLTGLTGAGQVIVPAWQGRSGWITGPAVRLAGRRLLSAGYSGAGGWALVLSGGDGMLLPGPGSAWRQLPPLPAGTAGLAAAPGQPACAIAARRDLVTVWQLAGNGARWERSQTLKVAVPYGSSG